MTTIARTTFDAARHGSLADRREFDASADRPARFAAHRRLDVVAAPADPRPAVAAAARAADDDVEHYERWDGLA
jgi:hypothetical protein